MYLGLDLTASEGKPSAFALLDGSPRLRDVGLAHSDAEIIELALRWRPALVAIDAPLFYPKGWHCLEWPCPEGLCPPPPWSLRTAERELYRQGIGLYATTKRSIIKAMVYRAIGLRRALASQGLAVIEVFPYASKVRLFGAPVPKKTTPEGSRWLRERLEPLIEGLSEQPALNHDHLDALVAAYTAYLYANGQGEEIGDPDEGTIIAPVPVTFALPRRE